MGEWPVVAIGDMVDDIIDRRGVTPIKLGSQFTVSGHRVISAKLVKGGAIDLAADEPRYVDERTYKRWMRNPLRADDVILTSEAPLGEVAYLHSDVDWVLGQRLFGIRTDKRRLLGRFLYYALQAQPTRSELLARATGTTAQGIRQTELRLVRVPLPPLAEQRRIADILGTLDDKIEFNRQVAETLGATVKALFEGWFLGVDSSDWPLAALGEYVVPMRGLSYRGDGLSTHGKPLHNLNSVREGGGYKPDGLKRYSGESLDRHLVVPGDVIVTNTEQGHDRLLIGHAAIVPGLFGSVGLFSHHLYRLRMQPGSPLSPDYVCHLLNSRGMHEIVSGYSNGTTVQMLPAEALQRPEIHLPPIDLVRRFTEFAAASRVRTVELLRESQGLAEIRDSLHPRFLSGDLKVSA